MALFLSRWLDFAIESGVTVSFIGTGMPPAPPIRIGDDVDCDYFDWQEQAQHIYLADLSDPFGLDGPPGPDNDTVGEPGVACEGLPRWADHH